MSPLHVCIVGLKCYDHIAAKSVPRYLGGIETQLTILAKGLVAQGCRVSLITYDHGQPDAEIFDGVTVFKSYHRDAGVRTSVGGGGATLTVAPQSNAQPAATDCLAREGPSLRDCAAPTGPTLWVPAALVHLHARRTTGSSNHQERFHLGAFAVRGAAGETRS